MHIVLKEPTKITDTLFRLRAFWLQLLIETYVSML